MKHFGLLLLTYVCCVLQTSCREAFAVRTIEPHFPMLALMIVVLTVNGESAVVWAAMIGLLSDSLTPGRLGVEMLCSLLAVVCVLRWTTSFNPASLLRAVTVGSGTVVTALSSAAIARSLLAEQHRNAVDLVTISGIAAYTAVLGLGLFIVLRILHRLWPLHRGNGSHRSAAHWNRLITEA